MNASLNVSLAVSGSVLAPEISQGELSLFRGWLVSKRLLEDSS